MMDTVIYFSLAGAYIGLFLLGCLHAQRYGWMTAENVLLLVIAALLYDNAILALGKYAGEGSFLRSLNLVRYGLHALITPLLILFAWRTLVHARLPWAGKTVTLGLAVVLTIGSMLIEWATEVRGIALKPVWKNGVFSYDKAEQSGMPPLMILIVTAVLFVTSVIIWRRQKWPVYFLGVASMGAAPLLQYALNTDAAHNLAEFVLMSALLATSAYQQRKRLRLRAEIDQVFSRT